MKEELTHLQRKQELARLKRNLPILATGLTLELLLTSLNGLVFANLFEWFAPVSYSLAWIEAVGLLLIVRLAVPHNLPRVTPDKLWPTLWDRASTVVFRAGYLLTIGYAFHLIGA